MQDGTELFWSRVDVRGPGECWLWGFHVDRLGYGTVAWRGRVWKAHRLAWVLATGECLGDRKVLHLCDMRACCNPAHLRSGTQAENVADMMAKGRYKAVGATFHGVVGPERKAELREAYRVALFWSKVDRRGPDECWEWMACRNRKGYGCVGVAPSKSDRAHRVAYRLAKGPISAGMCVMHACDNPPCVNPAHLVLGTKSENSLDMHCKGRSRRGNTPKGGSHHNAKLTEQAVREIRAAVAAGVMQKVLCERFGVSAGTMSEIVNRKAWTHIS